MASETELSDAITLSVPQPGAHQLRIISPTVLELGVINSKRPDPARVDRWDLVDANGQLHAPANGELTVLADGQLIQIQSVGFKRRPWYAPLRQRDLRIADYLYLKLAAPVAAGQTVVVQNPSSRLWPADWNFKAKADPFRYSPAIHVNQVGYLPGFPKSAVVGYYLGNLGELSIPGSSAFQLIDHQTGRIVFEGVLTPRKDAGYEYSPPPYQQVLEADFSPFVTPGQISGAQFFRARRP